MDFRFLYNSKKSNLTLLQELKNRSLYGRENPFMSNMIFFTLLILFILIILWMPVAEFALNAKLIRHLIFPISSSQFVFLY